MASPGRRKRTVFQNSVALMKDAGIENPALDAAFLLGHVTGEATPGVLLNHDSILQPGEIQRYSDLVRRRCERVPVSRLVGYREFFSRTFSINGDVLDPRPETEVLVEAGLEYLQKVEGSPRVLDVGTGSGAIAVTVAAEDPRVHVTATDISRKALAMARINAERHSVLDRVAFLQADLLRGISEGERFHLVLSNPPYIPLDQLPQLPEEVRNSDPHLALLSGPEGMDCYPFLAAGSINILHPGGRLMVEVGLGQKESVACLMQQAGFVQIEVISDLAGTGRVVKGTKQGA